VNFDQKKVLEKADLVEINGLTEGSSKEHGQKKRRRLTCSANGSTA